MGTGPERKLAAIMLADIAGFSALMERDESGTFERIKALRERLVAPRVASHGGRIIKTTGDGFLAEFPSATSALQCAIEIQRQNHQQELTFMPEARIHMRMGINVGDVIIDGDDVAGDGVVIAARLEPLAPPDGICVSSTVREHIRQELGVEYHDLGEQHVKNISRPIRAYQIDLTGAPMVSAKAVAAKTGRGRARAAIAVGALVVVAIAIAAAYRWMGARDSGTDTRMTFAILPFASPGGDAAAAAFASGVTDAFITRQANSQWSRVVSRESVEAAQRGNPSTMDLGRTVGARYLVRGSVAREGPGFKVTSAVIEASSGRVLGTRDLKWPEGRSVNPFYAELDDAMGNLAAKGYRLELEDAKRKADADLDARDLAYLANENWKHDRASYEKAMGYLRRAQAIAPDDRLVLALLANVNLCECRAKWATHPDDLEKIGTEAVDRYLSRHPPNRYMQGWKAYINELHGRYEENLVLYERMLEKAPDDPELLSGVAATLVKLGRAKEAAALMEKVLREDTSAGNRAQMADIQFMLGNDAKASEYARLAIAEMSRNLLSDPWAGGVHLTRVAAEARAGNVPRAKAVLADFRALVPEATSVAAIRKWQDPRALRAGYEPYYKALRMAGLPEE